MNAKPGMEIRDSRLPENVAIYHNQWEEFVAIDTETGSIAKYNGICVSGSRTLDGAINKYLNKITNQPCYLEA